VQCLLLLKYRQVQIKALTYFQFDCSTLWPGASRNYGRFVAKGAQVAVVQPILISGKDHKVAHVKGAHGRAVRLVDVGAIVDSVDVLGPGALGAICHGDDERFKDAVDCGAGKV
jgi:hypothetical protein